MDAKHLNRAQKIVEGIAWCRNALSYEGPTGVQSLGLNVSKARPGSTQPQCEIFYMSQAVKDLTFKAWRREVQFREAAFRREAAQIGLMLED